MGLFDQFTNTSYTFLQLQSKAGGNVIVSETEAEGIFKIRSGMVEVLNIESFGGVASAAASLHIKPDEPFLDAVGRELVGHGIRVAKSGSEPLEYRIEGQVEGFDFDTGELEFYKVTLKRESTWDESQLPLE